MVGGWLVDGVPVCPGETGEDLAEVEVRAGLGLVPFAVDVHAARWGTLARLVTVVGRGAAPYGVAVDENTLLHVADGEVRVAGPGRAHAVRPDGDGGVRVRSYRAGEGFSSDWAGLHTPSASAGPIAHPRRRAVPAVVAGTALWRAGQIVAVSITKR
ncbi:hypothetical protein SRB17_31040 [Streptomyces sp. RB17]|uniref:hypothetical protein n=1 Tax=Streptomyces sp. RB17 TaxID=2585197 RepID=UPI00130A5C46|nr:hypothetical protein [Streptomyces sp. RB17]MQY35132.1 hypothetical protein [Streptomyces sp. RB17]